MAMESSLNILSSYLLTRTNSFEIVEQLSAALCVFLVTGSFMVVGSLDGSLSVVGGGQSSSVGVANQVNLFV